jgi:mono/diheme cytochrome c family protein
MLGLFPLLVTAHGFAQDTDRPGLGPYRVRCAICHGQNAAVHARRTLKLDGSQVMLKRTGALLDEFLLTHGRADAHDRQELIALFQRLLGEEKLR